MVSKMVVSILQIYAYCAVVLLGDKLQKGQILIVDTPDRKEGIDVPKVDDEAVPSRFLGNHKRWRDVVWSLGEPLYCPRGNIVRQELVAPDVTLAGSEWR